MVFTELNFMLDKFGNVFSAPSDVPGAPLSRLGYVGPGRPLGYHVHKGVLTICDSLKGLTQLDTHSGRLVILSNRVSSASALQPNS